MHTRAPHLDATDGCTQLDVLIQLSSSPVLSASGFVLTVADLADRDSEVHRASAERAPDGRTPESTSSTRSSIMTHASAINMHIISAEPVGLMIETLMRKARAFTSLIFNIIRRNKKNDHDGSVYICWKTCGLIKVSNGHRM